MKSHHPYCTRVTESLKCNMQLGITSFISKYCVSVPYSRLKRTKLLGRGSIYILIWTRLACPSRRSRPLSASKHVTGAVVDCLLTAYCLEQITSKAVVYFVCPRTVCLGSLFVEILLRVAFFADSRRGRDIRIIRLRSKYLSLFRKLVCAVSSESSVFCSTHVAFLVFYSRAIVAYGLILMSN